ncbi:PLP-dependent aminotransferase family protein [Haloechinothrix sp. YIM 98757]|uniref:PLP-dependent aminotransferase family protein n=1 Tax=Haloechinothrix aidingensis TaxID=2752311 RepID=A0A838AET2_9PSEU|nr:PLP-dependent aminotransferase family protein [Haloechinothrix aidingensis]MBA0127826.1 PLP-dependent aminotransferase family protein [Haloechinothrix aidingensis]
MGRTLVSVDRDGSEPVYQQLRKALEHALATGALDPTRALPSSRELARELGISRNTANAAYQELLAEGFIESRPRRGLFVNPEMLPHLHREGAAPEEGATRGSIGEWSRRLRDRPDTDMPEIAKIGDWHTYPYPFVAGQVDAGSFPRLAWSRALREALEQPHLHYSLRDGIDEDDPLLVEALCRQVLPTRGIEVDPDNVLITLGSQQGLDLLAYTLLRPGDAVGVEDPGYLDARHIFARAGAEIVPLGVDGSGLVPPSSLDGIDLLHLTPSHQSPTNVTLSIGRRKELLAQADRADTLFIEDDFDSEFRYQGSPTPALKALPGSDRVVYLGTFSKFLAPGLRLGYLVADPELIRELRGQRRYRVRHASGHIQRAMALFIGAGEYQKTIRRRRTQLQRKWRTLRDALNETLPWQVSPPPGGVSIWVAGPERLDGALLAERALDLGVVIERGDIFFSAPDAHRNHFRLGFAAIPHDAVRPGVARLAEAVAEQLG